MALFPPKFWGRPSHSHHLTGLQLSDCLATLLDGNSFKQHAHINARHTVLSYKHKRKCAVLFFLNNNLTIKRYSRFFIQHNLTGQTNCLILLISNIVSNPFHISSMKNMFRQRGLTAEFIRFIITFYYNKSKTYIIYSKTTCKWLGFL